MAGKPTGDNTLGLDAIFGDDEENPLDLSSFKPTPQRKADAPPRKEIHERAKKEGFTNRGGDNTVPKPRAKKLLPANTPDGPMRRSRYYETGRNAQFNKKVRPEDRDRFNKICDNQDWVGGQGLQYALDALEEKLSAPDDTFWQERNFKGVD